VEEDLTNLAFTWKIIRFNETEMVVQIDFAEPFNVSMSTSGYDILVVSFVDNAAFVTKKNVPMPANWTMSAKVPT